MVGRRSRVACRSGRDYLVDLADRVLRRNPKHLIFFAPMVTYLMTFMAVTGHTAFSTMPVITEVANENNIRPSRPLSVAVVASQIASTASPISAADRRDGTDDHRLSGPRTQLDGLARGCHGEEAQPGRVEPLSGGPAGRDGDRTRRRRRRRLPRQRGTASR